MVSWCSCQSFYQPCWSAGLPPEVQHAEHPRPLQEFELNLPTFNFNLKPVKTRYHQGAQALESQQRLPTDVPIAQMLLNPPGILFLWEQSVFSRVIHSNTTKLTFPDFERACLYNHGTKRPATHSGCFFSSKSTLTRVCVLELYCCGDKRGYFACNPEFPDANPSEKAYMWWIYHTFPPSLRQIYWFLKSSLSNPNIPL